MLSNPADYYTTENLPLERQFGIQVFTSYWENVNQSAPLEKIVEFVRAKLKAKLCSSYRIYVEGMLYEDSSDL